MSLLGHSKPRGKAVMELRQAFSGPGRGRCPERRSRLEAKQLKNLSAKNLQVER